MPFSIRLILAGLHCSTSAACAVVTPAASRKRRSSEPTRRDLTVGWPPDGMSNSLSVRYGKRTDDRQRVKMLQRLQFAHLADRLAATPVGATTHCRQSR